MKLDKIERDGLRVLTVDAERIDAAVAIRFKDLVREQTREAPPRVVLDLDKVTFIDSSGLGAIVAAMKLMPQGTKLELASLSEAVEKVFRLTRMDTVFAIHPGTGTL